MPCDSIAIWFKLLHIFSLKKYLQKNLRNRIVAHIFATDWFRKQKFKDHGMRNISGNSRSGMEGTHNINCLAGHEE